MTFTDTQLLIIKALHKGNSLSKDIAKESGQPIFRVRRILVNLRKWNYVDFCRTYDPNDYRFKHWSLTKEFYRLHDLKKMGMEVKKNTSLLC